mgnify:CR=1 FL=1
MDAQSVKGTNTARQKGRDAGERISDIKRHITVKTQGLPPAMMAVTAAEVSGCKGRCKSGLSRLQSLLCDGGYAGQPFEQGVRGLLVGI